MKILFLKIIYECEKPAYIGLGQIHCIIFTAHTSTSPHRSQRGPVSVGTGPTPPPPREPTAHAQVNNARGDRHVSLSVAPISPTRVGPSSRLSRDGVRRDAPRGKSLMNAGVVGPTRLSYILTNHKFAKKKRGENSQMISAVRYSDG